jgi:hypothetical protein
MLKDYYYRMNVIFLIKKVQCFFPKIYLKYFINNILVIILLFNLIN